MNCVSRLVVCVLALVLGVAAQSSECPKKYWDKDCTEFNGEACSISAQWLLEMEKCPEGGGKHLTMVMPDKREFLIYSKTGKPFKIANIKEYFYTVDHSGNATCAWNSEPFEPKQPPFTDDTDGGLTAFYKEHDLTINQSCVGCYKLDLIFEAPSFKASGKSGSISKEPAIDPHIQTGGSGKPAFTDADTCLYQECLLKTKDKGICETKLRNLSKAAQLGAPRAP